MAVIPAEVWLGDRTVEWRVDVCDATGTPVADPLPAPESTDGQSQALGSLDMKLDAQSLMRGSVTTVEDPQSLLGRFLRPVMMINGHEQQVGLFKATADPARLGLAGVRDVEMIDASISLARNLLITPLILKAGTNATGWVRSRLALVAPSLVAAIGDSGETLRTDLFFDVGDSELEIANQVLTAANHTPLRMTLGGVLASRPWVAPSERAVAWVFDADDFDSIVLTDYMYDTDYLALPNRVLVEARGGGNAEPLTGLWEDNSPTSPWGFDNRGQEWVTNIVKDADVTSQAALTQMARKELIDAQQAAVTLEFEHPWVPMVPGDVVEFRSESHGIAGRFEVQTIGGPSMDVDAMTSTTARKVVDL